MSNLTDFFAYALKNAVGAWTKQQYNATTTLTDGATINWDLDDNPVAQVTLAGNRTVAAPTNMQDGSVYTLEVIQDATGSRTLSWNAVFKFGDAGTPVLNTDANSVDIFTFQSDGTNMRLRGSSLGVDA